MYELQCELFVHAELQSLRIHYRLIKSYKMTSSNVSSQPFSDVSLPQNNLELPLTSRELLLHINTNVLLSVKQRASRLRR